jgi:hypothetical protein
MRHGFTREPSGSAYQELLEFCGSRSVVATLVIRELDWLEEDAIAVMERLRPSQIETAERSEWAGTRLIEHTATVYSYRVDEALVRALQTSASGLYEWQQPHRPEDLAFLRSDGHPLLVSIAHEGDGYLDIEVNEIAGLERYPHLLDICRIENA